MHLEINKCSEIELVGGQSKYKKTLWTKGVIVKKKVGTKKGIII